MAMIEVSIVPVGTKNPSLSQYVARAVKVLREEKDIKYELTAMGTIIEGELEKLLEIAGKMHRAAFTEDISRLVTSIRIDERRDKPSSIAGKVASVRQKLGK
ncbi:MAG: MTH1187 family thiamine-binding protein [Dehalococcoidales bacterium]|nr:MTH1187 family thiamine-binding protein [Dehalococcoidales bacterium]